MNTTTRLLALCEEKKCCPLGLASMLLPSNPPWLDGSDYGWHSQDFPFHEDAARWIRIHEDDAAKVAMDWDGSIGRGGANRYKAMHRLLHLGGFCRPPKQLTRCERRWIGVMA